MLYKNTEKQCYELCGMITDVFKIYRQSRWQRPTITTTKEAEAGKPQAQDLSGLSSEFKVILGNLNETQF